MSSLFLTSREYSSRDSRRRLVPWSSLLGWMVANLEVEARLHCCSIDDENTRVARLFLPLVFLDCARRERRAHLLSLLIVDALSFIGVTRRQEVIDDEVGYSTS